MASTALDPLRQFVEQFGGHKICDMTPEQQIELFAAVAERGGAAALAGIGLNDEFAVGDIRDIRAVLKSYKVIRKQVWGGFWSHVGKIIAAFFTFWLIGLAVGPERLSVVTKFMGLGR